MKYQPYVGSCFASFYPSMPILHQPLFVESKMPPIMVKTLVAIGALYSGRRKVSNECGRLHDLSQELWTRGSSELEMFVSVALMLA